MKRFATVVALALATVGTAQAVSANPANFIDYDGKVQVGSVKNVKRTTGVSQQVPAGEVYDAKTLATMNLSATDTVNVTAFETTGELPHPSDR